MTALASTVDREIQSSSQLHGNISKLIEKLDQNLDLFKDQLTLEREARIEADSREKDARVALATDFRVFTTRVLVALGIVVFIAQFGVTLFGPIIRAAVGLPK